MPSTATRLLLKTLNYSGRSGITYILRDEFLTPASAPLASPRTAEPGPGEMVRSADASNVVSIASGKMHQTNAASASYYWRDNVGNGFPRVAGRCMRWVQPDMRNAPAVGLASNISPLTFAYAHNATALSRAGVNANGVFEWTAGQQHTLGFVLRNTGAFIFQRGGSFGAVALRFVDSRGTDATLWPLVTGTASATIDVADTLSIRDLGGDLASDYGLALVNVTNPVSGTIYDSTADTITKAIFTLPGSPATGDHLELRYRVKDANNYQVARIEWNNGTSQWDFKRQSVAAGTPTALGSTATNVGSGVVEIQVRAIGINLDYWRLTTATYTSSGQQTSANVQTQRGVAVSFQGVTVTKLESYPVNDPRYGGVDDQSTSGVTYLAVGDSKSLYLAYSAGLANAVSARAYVYEKPARIAVTGRTVATTQDNIDTALAGLSSSDTPNYVLWNLGANDVASLPSESAWKADLRYCYDAIHTKYPSAHLYYMRVWRRSQLTNCNTLATWYADVAAEAAYVGWVHAGPDERVFLENGDDGATYTADGIHPNAAGYILTGQQWATALGL